MRRLPGDLYGGPGDDSPSGRLRHVQPGPGSDRSLRHLSGVACSRAVDRCDRAGPACRLRRLPRESLDSLAFAVSPDDRRIAVAVITYRTASSAEPFSLRLYVEDLAAGANRTAVFSSSSLAEWPVGWRAGGIVLAIGRPGVFTGFNPYAAVEYHLVEPETWALRAPAHRPFGERARAEDRGRS